MTDRLPTVYAEARRRIAKSLLNAREAHKWSQEEAAHRCGMPVKLFASIERGTWNPTLKTLAKLSVGLQMDVAKLFAKPRR